VARGHIAEYLDAKDQETLSISVGIKSQIATRTAYRKSLIYECVTDRRQVMTADVTWARREEAGASLPF
jgi:hypothetical protein